MNKLSVCEFICEFMVIWTTNAGRALLFSACPSVCLSAVSVTLTLIFNRISFKFHIWVAPSNSDSSSNMGFVRQTISKMADKMAAPISYAVVVALT